MKLSLKLYCLLRFVFPVNLVFIMFATGVSAGSTSQFLGTNLNPALVIGPKALVFYLFSQYTFKLESSVTQVIKEEEKHTKNECSNIKYIKVVAQCFKKAFFLSSNCYSLYWILQLLINRIHQSDMYYIRFWLDKSCICNKTLRLIQLFEDSLKSK